MGQVQFANNAISRLVGPLTTSSASCTVTPGDGVLFPTLAAGDWFMATLIRADGAREIVKVTSRTVDAMSITRAQENTAALNFSPNDRIEARLTKGTLDDMVAKTAAAQAMVLSYQANLDVLYGVRGSTDSNANWSAAPTTGQNTQFRLKVAKGILSRPNNPAGPLILSNFDEMAVLATVGPNGQDGTILNDTTNRAARVFIIYGDSVAPKLVVTANTTPDLSNAVLFAGYTLYKFICLGDTTGVKWNWAFKLTGNRLSYFSARSIMNVPSPASSTVYAAIFYPGQEGIIIEFDIETFLSVSTAANSYGEMSLNLSPESGNSSAQNGAYMVARAIAYGTSIATTSYGGARGSLPYPVGGNVKTFTSAVSGSLIGANMFVNIYGYTLANNAIN